MKIIFGLFLITLITQSIDPLIYKTVRQSSSGEHCQIVLNQLDLNYEATRRESNMANLKKSFSLDASHILPIIVNGLGKDKQQLQLLIETAKKEVLSFSGVYIFGIVVLLGMVGYWCFGFLGYNKRNKRLEFNNSTNLYFSIKSRIGIAGMILSLLFVIVMCLYGIDSSLIFEKATNQIVCTLFQQPTGFQRRVQNNQDFDLVDMVSQLKKVEVFLTQKYELMQPLMTNKTLNSIQANIKQLLTDYIYQQKQDGHDLKLKLNKALSAIQFLNSGNITQSIQMFNNTIQFARELLMAYHIILNSLDIYIARNIGVESIGASINIGYKLLYGLFLLVALGSYVGMGWIIVKEDRKLLFFKDISLYLTGVCCLTAFTVAIINSILVSSIMWTSQLTNHLIQKQQTFKEQLGNIKILNQMIADLIVKFSPFSDGNLGATNHGALKKDAMTLISALQILNSQQFVQQISSQFLIFYNSREDAQLDQNKIINDFINDFTAELFLQMKTAKDGAQAILHLISEQGAMSQLDASALGQYVSNIINLLYEPIFNGIYEQRWILGLCGFALLSNLIFVYMIEITTTQYISISNKEQEKLHLSNVLQILSLRQ